MCLTIPRQIVPLAPAAEDRCGRSPHLAAERRTIGRSPPDATAQATQAGVHAGGAGIRAALHHRLGARRSRSLAELIVATRSSLRRAHRSTSRSDVRRFKTSRQGPHISALIPSGRLRKFVDGFWVHAASWTHLRRRPTTHNATRTAPPLRQRHRHRRDRHRPQPTVAIHAPPGADGRPHAMRNRGVTNIGGAHDSGHRL